MADVHALRPYQLAAIDAVERAWERGERAPMIVMATGTGKTTVFSEIIRRHYARTGVRSLVLAHRLELIEQAAARLTASGVMCEIESGARRASRLGATLGVQAVVATVQTMRGRRLSQWPRDSFGLVVIDEAHRATAQLYRDILDWYDGARVLGVTATPDRGDGVAVGEVFTAGSVYEYGIAAGIRDGYLCDIRARTIDLDCVTIEGVRTSRQEHGRDLRADDLAAAMAGDEALHAIAAPLAQEAGERSTLVFMPSVELAHELARVLSGYVGAHRVRSLDGGSDSDDRARAIAAYQSGEVQYLVNCALFTEGFDAPRTSCVAIARPTKSRALYAQMVGRGTRLYPGKTDCLVLDFYPQNTRHDLAKVVDVFDGEPLDETTRAERDALVRSGETVAKATEEAKRLAREREEKRAREREAAGLQVRARYEARERHVWTVDADCGISERDYSAPRVREDQILRMQMLKIEIDSRETVRTASAKIARVLQRRKLGLCTLKQARVLARAGLSTELSFEDARAALDALASNGWRPTAELRARYGAAR
jgi:superfamily II DNA or RNA helicase